MSGRQALVQFTAALQSTIRVTSKVHPSGTRLRDLLLETAISPYNGGASAINCRGLGTCGTCAVKVSGAGVTPMHWREKMRLSLPPHNGQPGIERGLRLACQCRVLPGADITVTKPLGFWGHRHEPAAHCDRNNSAQTASEPEQIAFDINAIRQLKPFPSWLASEMRSNQAGETGAVYIYSGAATALTLRRKWGWSTELDDPLREFVTEHRETERLHLMLLNQILDDADRSIFLPLWRLSGSMLGFVSTIWCPRGMYVTTDAVETFVTEHYQYQIQRLKSELVDAGSEGNSGATTLTPEASPGSAAGWVKEDMTTGTSQSGISLTTSQSQRNGRQELLRLLSYCCEDEQHHQQEAAIRAAQGPLPWYPWVDVLWKQLVFWGSKIAAGIAKQR